MIANLSAAGVGHATRDGTEIETATATATETDRLTVIVTESASLWIVIETGTFGTSIDAIGTVIWIAEIDSIAVTN
jgi:hypothetical protein